MFSQFDFPLVHYPGWKGVTDKKATASCKRSIITYIPSDSNLMHWSFGMLKIIKIQQSSNIERSTPFTYHWSFSDKVLWTLQKKILAFFYSKTKEYFVQSFSNFSTISKMYYTTSLFLQGDSFWRKYEALQKQLMLCWTDNLHFAVCWHLMLNNSKLVVLE